MRSAARLFRFKKAIAQTATIAVLLFGGGAEAVTRELKTVATPEQHASGVIGPAQLALDLPFVVDPSPQGFVLVTSASMVLTVALVDPSGQRVEAGQTDLCGVTASGFWPEAGAGNPEAPGRDWYFQLQDPLPGDWHLLVEAPPTTLVEDLVLSSVVLASPVRAVLIGGEVDVPVGSPATFSVVVADGTATSLGTSASGLVYKVGSGGFTPQPVTFADDGLGTDATAGDGLLSTSVRVNEPGEFILEVEVFGLAASGHPFRRTLTSGFRAFPQGIALVPGTFDAACLDRNGDGKVDVLRIEFDVEAAIEAPFRFEVALASALGSATESLTVDAAPAGVSRVGVEFDSATLLSITPSEAAGSSFALARILVERFGEGDPVVEFERFDLGVVDACPLSAFDLPPVTILETHSTTEDCDGDGLIDSLRLDVDLYFRVAGSWSWSGTLVDAAGVRVETRAGTAEFGGGRQTISLDFPGELVGARAAAGLLRLDDFSLAGGASPGHAATSIRVPSLATAGPFPAGVFEVAEVQAAFGDDFETRSPGPVGPESGWIVTQGATSGARFESSSTFDGRMTLRVSHDPSLPLGSEWGVFSPRFEAIPGAIETVTMTLAIEGAGGRFDVIVQDPVADRVVARVRFDEAGGVHVLRRSRRSTVLGRTQFALENSWIALATMVPEGDPFEMVLRKTKGAGASGSDWLEITVGGIPLAAVECPSGRFGQVVILSDNGLSRSIEFDSVRLEVQPSTGDCDGDGASDRCEIAAATMADCDLDGAGDPCEADCNGNGVPDDCDLAAGTSRDEDGDRIPDECGRDCNGDGVLDDLQIARGEVPDCNSNGIPDVCELSGLGLGFADPFRVDLAAQPSGGEVIDLDGDGNGEIVVLLHDSIGVFAADGLGGWVERQSVPLATPRVVRSADFDRDGRLELLVVEAQSPDFLSSLTLLGVSPGGELSVASRVPFADRFYVDAVDVGDANADGFPDVVAIDYAGASRHLAVFAGTGSLALTEVFSLPLVVESQDPRPRVKLADVDSDGSLDAVILRNNPQGLAWLRNDGHGRFGNPRVIGSQSSSGEGLLVGDIDGDEDPDLVAMDGLTSRIRLFRNAGAAFSTELLNTPLFNARLVRLVDLDLDGALDLVATEQGGYLLAFLGNGEGGFALYPYEISTGGAGGFFIAADDVDGNRSPDLVAIDPSEPGLVVLRNELVAPGDLDCDGNSVPDSCQSDCDGDRRPDVCALSRGEAVDLNRNGVPDSCDIASGSSVDCDENGVPDDAETGGVQERRYRVIALGDVQSEDRLSPAGIDRFGSVGGTEPAAFGSRAVRWKREGGVRDLGVPALSGPTSVAWAISDQGEVVGSVVDDLGPRAARWPRFDRPQLLEGPPGPGAYWEAYGVSPDGSVAGYWGEDEGDSAILWPADGSPVRLGTLVAGEASWAYGVNDANVVVGESGPYPSGCHAFRWTAAGGMVDLGVRPGHDHSWAAAINSAGIIVGVSESAASGDGLAVLWSRCGGPFALGIGSVGARSQAFDINDSGDIAGWIGTADGASRGVIWNRDGELIDLTERLLPGEGEWEVEAAAGINDDGWVAAVARSAGGEAVPVVLVPVDGDCDANGRPDRCDQPASLIQVTSVQPSSGVAGSLVTIGGAGFSSSTKVRATIPGAPAVDCRVIAVSPEFVIEVPSLPWAPSGLIDLKFSNPGQCGAASASSAFALVEPGRAVLRSRSAPTAGGTVVEVNCGPGCSFDSNTRLIFGAAGPGTTETVPGHPETIRVTTPAGLEGVVSLALTGAASGELACDQARFEFVQYGFAVGRDTSRVALFRSGPDPDGLASDARHAIDGREFASVQLDRASDVAVVTGPAGFLGSALMVEEGSRLRLWDVASQTFQRNYPPESPPACPPDSPSWSPIRVSIDPDGRLAYVIHGARESRVCGDLPDQTSIPISVVDLFREAGATRDIGPADLDRNPATPDSQVDIGFPPNSSGFAADAKARVRATEACPTSPPLGPDAASWRNVGFFETTPAPGPGNDWKSRFLLVTATSTGPVPQFPCPRLPRGCRPDQEELCVRNELTGHIEHCFKCIPIVCRRYPATLTLSVIDLNPLVADSCNGVASVRSAPGANPLYLKRRAVIALDRFLDFFPASSAGIEIGLEIATDGSDRVFVLAPYSGRLLELDLATVLDQADAARDPDLNPDGWIEPPPEDFIPLSDEPGTLPTGAALSSPGGTPNLFVALAGVDEIQKRPTANVESVEFSPLRAYSPDRSAGPVDLAARSQSDALFSANLADGSVSRIDAATLSNRPVPIETSVSRVAIQPEIRTEGLLDLTASALAGAPVSSFGSGAHQTALVAETRSLEVLVSQGTASVKGVAGRVEALLRNIDRRVASPVLRAEIEAALSRVVGMYEQEGGGR